MLQAGQSLMQIEETYIKLTLDHVRGNRKHAAEMLGISLRTLQNRIAELREEAKVAVPACDGARVRLPLEQASSPAERSGPAFAQEGAASEWTKLVIKGSEPCQG